MWRFLPPLGLPERMRPRPRSVCYWLALHFPTAEAASQWYLDHGPLPDPYARLLQSGERLPFHIGDDEKDIR